MLGFGRAIGEAIAVSQVIGGVPAWPLNLFQGGYTNASVIANQFASPVSALHTSSLFYLALILLVLGMATNLVGPVDLTQLRSEAGMSAIAAPTRQPGSEALAERQRQPPAPPADQPSFRER